MNDMVKELWCTIGPASLNERVLKRLEDLGVSLFRINLSHTPLELVEKHVGIIQRYSNVPVCLDTEGAQIRTGVIQQGGMKVLENEILTVIRKPIDGQDGVFNLNPIDIMSDLIPGDIISIDFNSVFVQVVDVNPEKVTMRVLNPGSVGMNKAVTVERDIELPVLSSKDKSAIEIGMRMGLKHVALSFANRAEDVHFLRDLVKESTKIISKIECRNALVNLDEIITASDAILIDRGDLSRQEPLERIPLLQKKIISRAKVAKKRVYVATNLLESMVLSPKPTRAEVNDVMNTLIDGADGLILAAETAIGKHPIGCANMIVRLLKEFTKGVRMDAPFSSEPAVSLLPEPHGGELRNSEILKPSSTEFSRFRRLPVADSTLFHCEQIATGGYSPVTGFMDEKSLFSVLRECKLISGLSWGIPILLQVDDSTAQSINIGESIVLTDCQGVEYALLDVSQVYPLNIEEVMRLWFGRQSPNHPDVVRFKTAGSYAIAGRVSLFKKKEHPGRCYELPPAQARALFAHKEWNRVIGYQSAYIYHRGCEKLLEESIVEFHADGVYINPVFNEAKNSEVYSNLILNSYTSAMRSGECLPGKSVLGALYTHSYSSPIREIIQTAITKKNSGCSFMIIENLTKQYSADVMHEIKEIFKTRKDLQIEPIFYESISYDPNEDVFSVYEADQSKIDCIDSEDLSQWLLSVNPYPEWLFHKEVQKLMDVYTQTHGSTISS